MARLPHDPNKPRAERKPRAPSAPKPAYIIIQVLDENGSPIQFDKSRVKILSIERDAQKVLDLVESNSNPGAFYLRAHIPSGRGQEKSDNVTAMPNAA